jgi:hypothetical protein
LDIGNLGFCKNMFRPENGSNTRMFPRNAGIYLWVQTKLQPGRPILTFSWLWNRQEIENLKNWDFRFPQQREWKVFWEVTPCSNVESSVNFCETVRRNTPRDSNLQPKDCQDISLFYDSETTTEFCVPEWNAEQNCYGWRTGGMSDNDGDAEYTDADNWHGVFLRFRA